MGLGDEIMAMGEAEALYEATGRPVAVCDKHGSPRWHRAWENNPAVSKTLGKDIGTIINCPGKRSYIKRWSHSPRRTEFNHDHRARAGKIRLTVDEYCMARMMSPLNPFAIIEPATRLSLRSSRNKEWGLDRWAEVVRDFPVPVYQFDIGDGTPLLEGVGVIRSDDFRVSAGIVKLAALVLTIDGGMHHIAASMGTDAVVVFGGFCDPKITGYASHANFYSDIDGSPCGRYDNCPHCKKAMALITPEQVRAEALRRLEAKHVS
jgi:hypothetical protein